MNIIELINQKIAALTEESNHNLESDLEIFEEHKMLAEEVESVLVNEDSIIDYNFNRVIELLKLYNYSTDDLIKAINDVKNVLAVRKELNLTSEELPLDERQKESLNALLTNIGNIKELANNQIEIIRQNGDKKQKIELLEQLKNILEGNGRRKYYTEEMFKVFCETIDITNMPPEDAKQLLQVFYQTKNLNSRVDREFATVDQIVAVFKEFLPDSKINTIERIAEDHIVEASNTFDEDNARNILQFFKDEGVLNNFDTLAVFNVAVAGNYEFIKNEIYPFISSNFRNGIQAFFKSQLSAFWLKTKDNFYRLTPFRRTDRRGNNARNEQPLVNYNIPNIYDFQKNIELLKQNQLLFADTYDFDDVESNLQLKTLPTWILKNNIELCRLFKLDSLDTIPISCVERCDIENKIHLAIELGLLHSPRTDVFLQLDKDIIKNSDFNNNCKKRNIANQSIRNYFLRNLSKIPSLTVNQFAYLAYRLKKEGYLSFYNNFFSENKAGQANQELLLYEFPQLLNSYNGMDDFVAQNFDIEWYSEFFSNYDEYDAIISEYKDDEKKENENNQIYIDSRILEDPLIQELEEKYRVNDHMMVKDPLTDSDQEIESNNEYIYMFNNQIISRYKVLNNASILKSMYGFLNREMLLTSVVRNSFLDDNTFQEINSMVTGRSQSI